MYNCIHNYVHGLSYGQFLVLICTMDVLSKLKKEYLCCHFNLKMDLSNMCNAKKKVWYRSNFILYNIRLIRFIPNYYLRTTNRGQPHHCSQSFINGRCILLTHAAFYPSWHSTFDLIQQQKSCPNKLHHILGSWMNTHTFFTWRNNFSITYTWLKLNFYFSSLDCMS